MNTIVSYVIGIALTIAAVFLPHQKKTTANSAPITFEEKQDALNIKNTNTASLKMEKKLE
jgi:hypothetical protein